MSARASGLNFKEGQLRIKVRARTNLVAAAALVRGVYEGVQLGSIEVARGIALLDLPPDLQNLRCGVHERDQLIQAIRGHDVLAIDASEHRGACVHVIEADLFEVRQIV